MSKFKKILLVLCAAALLLTGALVTALAETEYTGTVEEYVALLDAVDAAEGAVAKTEALAAADEYFYKENSIDPYAPGRKEALARRAQIADALELLKVTEANAMLTAYAENTTADLAARRTAIDEIKAFLDAVQIKPATEGYEAVMASYNEKLIAVQGEEVKLQIDAIEAIADTDKDAKLTAMRSLLDYIVDNGITDEALAAASVKDKVGDYEIAYVKNELETTVSLTNINTATNLVALNKVRALARRYGLDTERAGYQAYADLLASAEEAHAAQVALNYEELEKKASVEEYNYPEIFNYSGFEKNLMPKAVLKETQYCTLQIESGADPNNKDNHYVNIHTDRRGTATSDTGMLHNYTSNSITDRGVGMVVELKLTTFGEWPDAGCMANIKSNFVTDSGATGNNKYLSLWAISPDGDLGVTIDSIKKGQVFLEDALVPGEWLNLTIVFNPFAENSAERCEMYVDYQLVGKFDPMPGVVSIDPYEMRIGLNTTYGDVAIDDFRAYFGAAVRTQAKLQNMPQDEQFKYYADFLTQSEYRTVDSIVLAYSKATELLPAYWADSDGDGEAEYLTEDEAIKASVDTVVNFDIQALIDALKARNLEEFISAAEPLESIERNVDTIEDRQKLIDTLDALISEYGTYIDTHAESFVYYQNLMEAVRLEIADDTVIKEFTLACQRFDKSSTLSALEKNYAKAETARGSLTATAMEMLDVDGYEAFAAAYAVYEGANERIEVARIEDTSRRIVDCIGFISEYQAPETWEENATFINKYLLIIRQLLKSGYDPEYEGLQEALVIYEPINAYFYDKLQQEHKVVIEEALNKVPLTTSYIEKLGICAYITRYINSNDVDVNHEVIAPLAAVHQTYLSELELQEQDYANVLEQNTALFIDTVNRLKTAVSFTKIRELHATAYVYYYTMNVGSETAKEAIEIFEEYRIAIETVENGTVLLKGYLEANLAEAETENEIYAALVQCAQVYTDIKAAVEAFNMDDAWTVVENLADAKSGFESAYGDYMKTVSAANSDIENICKATGSVRSMPALAPMISVIVDLIVG